MKLIFVASIALAAYFVSSALRGSINMIFSWFRLNASYIRLNSSHTDFELTPMMIRSGRNASATAEPSFKNSGLEQTSKGSFFPLASSSAAIQPEMSSTVPTGDVDLLIITLREHMPAAMLLAALLTYCISTLPSLAEGVPTQIKM